MTGLVAALVGATAGAAVVPYLAGRSYRRDDDEYLTARRAPWWIPVALAAVGYLAGSVHAASIALVATIVATSVVMAVLTVIDLDVHRLPNVVVGPLAIGVVLALAVCSIGVGAEPWLRGVLAGAATSAAYLALAMISPGGSGLGLGDVKLAFPLGALTGWFSWESALTSAVGAFFVGALHALWILATRRGTRKSYLAFGPSMMLSALVVALFSTAPS